MRPQHYFDWQSIVDERADGPVENTRHRLRWVLGFFVLATVVVLARAVQLEVSDGENFRRFAATPLVHTRVLPRGAGKILARDGHVLAKDRPTKALAVQFRYLEQPPDAAWLRRMARARLPRGSRRTSEQVAAAETALAGELAELHKRLAHLCNVSELQWQKRTERIERRVAAVAATVDARRLEGFEKQLAAEAIEPDLSLWSVVTGLFAPPELLAPEPVTLAEHRAFHTIVDDVPAEVVAEIENHADRWPGAKIIDHVRRTYPDAALAANLVGHVGRSSPSGDEMVGLMGLEHDFDGRLSGQPGLETQRTDHRGGLIASETTKEPAAGADVVLSIDAALEQSAEAWLDRAMRRRRADAESETPPPSGGAIIVMDVRSGELLTAASSPRFDPNAFIDGDDRVEAILHDPRQPLFDRVTKMAIAPGSAFKPLTALAMLESNVVDPQSSFRCQGYLSEPDRLRCQIYRHHGIGHGDVALADALAQSCNVYFFHHAIELGAAPLLKWAGRFGFGTPTGIELAGETAGRTPTAADLHQTSQTQMFAIGQGAFAATPLQVVRMFAAIANGGRLVTPRLVLPSVAASSSEPSGTPIEGLSSASLDAVREGLVRVVNDPSGTAYETTRLAWPTIAGKTGTAETGGGQSDHAWFAGYAPTEAPRYALVVVLEHGGSGAQAAGSIARQLVLRMVQLGYFGPPPVANRPIPPGKG